VNIGPVITALELEVVKAPLTGNEESPTMNGRTDPDIWKQNSHSIIEAQEANKQGESGHRNGTS
jgi:hypothetical protein